MSKVCFILPDVIGGCFVNCSNIYHKLVHSGNEALMILTHRNQRQGISESALRDINHLIVYHKDADNRSHLFQQLERLIKEFAPDTIILNDYIDHQLVRAVRFPQQVISILHGDYEYYYELAMDSAARIDKFVCVSESIKEGLSRRLPNRVTDINYIAPMTRDFAMKTKGAEDVLKVLFIGRMTEEKGFHLLPLIDEQLRKIGHQIKWTIVAATITDIYSKWLGGKNVTHHEIVINDQMQYLYDDNDVLILPSAAEGTPLVLLECMKAGLVPIMSDLPTISENILANGKTGFRIKTENVEGYVNAIVSLDKDRDLLTNISERALETARRSLGEEQLYNQWQSVMASQISGKDMNAEVRSPYDRLDKKWLPNPIVKWIRSIRQKK
ncbi:MAG: glycosyltransferase family 4 protein [Bacteroidetes bacterium]|nr:glycosyltransferase family 4 protein [Bacteroidota bacterium]